MSRTISHSSYENIQDNSKLLQRTPEKFSLIGNMEKSTADRAKQNLDRSLSNSQGTVSILSIYNIFFCKFFLVFPFLYLIPP